MKQGIILAAGLGRRLQEITRFVPKSLIKINGQPLLERNIEFMIESGIKRICLVVGYKQECFAYLAEKYSYIDLHIIYNPEFATSNTVSSLNCVKKFFNMDSFITTADIYLHKNLFIKYPADYSCYILRPYGELETVDWVVALDGQNRFVSIDTQGLVGNAYTGVSFWLKKDLLFLKEHLDAIDWGDMVQRNQYWDELLLDSFDVLGLKAQIIEDNSEVYEFDNINDVHKLEKEMNITITW